MIVGGSGVSATVLPAQALVELAGFSINPLITIVALRDQGDAEIRYYVADGRHERTDTTLEIIDELRALALREGMTLLAKEQIVIQAEDMPIDVESVSWETQAGWKHVRLIPNLYYLLAKGYESFEPNLVPWNQRTPSIVWRGSTTGRFAQLVEGLNDVPRYRLCQLALRLGDGADFGITEVVQSAHPQQTDLIRERLRNEGHLRAFVPFAEMARHRFIMDIDGNSNSWNFMMKLRLGCCVLRVESLWRQWFSDRLVPWEHYVPVASDLSDFLERAEWCFTHPAESTSIAERGRKFAVDMKFSEELLEAARVIFAPTSVKNA